MTLPETLFTRNDACSDCELIVTDPNCRLNLGFDTPNGPNNPVPDCICHSVCVQEVVMVCTQEVHASFPLPPVGKCRLAAGLAPPPLAPNQQCPLFLVSAGEVLGDDCISVISTIKLLIVCVAESGAALVAPLTLTVTFGTFFDFPSCVQLTADQVRARLKEVDGSCQTIQLRASVNAAGDAILIDGKGVDQLWQHANLFFEALRPYGLSPDERNTGFSSFTVDTAFDACPTVCPPGPPGPPGPSGAKVLSGVDPPTCAIGQTGDLYVDLTTAQLYFKTVQPTPPLIRPIPPPTGNTLPVGSTRTYTTIAAALAAASNGDRLLLDAETFSITNTINVNKSVTIEGQGMGATTVITTSLSPSPFYMFNVTVSNVVFRNMSIIQDYPRSPGETDTVIAINNLAATGIYIDSCQISANEIGIGIKATEFQITNCSFTYAQDSDNNGYFYILISSTSGSSIIANNTFVSDSGPTRCRFIIITNITVSSGTLQGKLLIFNNTQQVSPFTLRHLLVIEEFVGSNFELYINNNTTINEGNVPVLFFPGSNNVLNIFRFIEVIGNSVKNTAGKGLIGIDSFATFSAGTTDIFSAGNTIALPFFTAGWASATVTASFIVGYNTAVISPAPELPLATCYWLPLV